MNKTPLFLLFTVFAFVAQAQGYKEKNARVVYAKLIEAFGDGRKAPELKFLNYKSIKDSIVAAYVPGDVPVIEIEEIAYDVCAGFGKDSLNALACVLGHELAHYYLKHDWCSNFSKRLSHISIAADLNKIDKQEQLKKESEADYNGFYFGNVAGYKTFDIAPSLLKKLYSAYTLNTNLKGYPTLDQRIEAATQSKIMVLRRLPVFEAGTYLYETGEYELAFDCFNNLISDFTSRENYNNAAVCKLQIALRLFEPYEMPFCFPFEMDYDTRISNGSNRSGSVDSETERKAILADAKKLLEESIRKDAEYLNAKINLAICYIMLDNADMAAGIIKEMAGDSIPEKRILNAIVAAHRGDFAKAIQYLGQANTDGVYSDAIAHNKFVFELARERNLRVGDDELGYQLRKNAGLPSTRQSISQLGEEELSCLDSTSKALKVITDSISVSATSKLFFMKGDKNYAHCLAIKDKSVNNSIQLYFVSDTNGCVARNPTATSNNRKKGSVIKGNTNGSVFVIKE
jgi:tetratricopeptide (TPR) repeat protein